MEKITSKDIINEENEIVDVEQLKHIMSSGIEKSVCKIIIKTKTGTGFFCNITQKNIKALITNNHVINEEFLLKEETLTYIIAENKEEIKKEINLKKNRLKITNKELDFTIIEILNEDQISNFLEIEENINIKDYEDEQIFTFQFPGGKKLKYSHGKNLGLKDNFFLYSVGTLGGSSGSPIILLENSKVIGLHKGAIKDNKDKINLGIPIKLIIDKISFIKCIYKITEENNNENIEIVGDINNETKEKTKIIIDGKILSLKHLTTYKFDKKGNYNVYFIDESPITDLSFMFKECSSLKEIYLSSFNTKQLTNINSMFEGCTSLQKIDLSNFTTDKVTEMKGLFSFCSSLKEINLSSFNTEKIKDMSYMFYKCLSLNEIDFQILILKMSII